MASSGLSTEAMSRPPSFLKNFSSAGVAPTRITGFPALSASATSDTVPAPISPQTTTTLLDMTLTLLRALPERAGTTVLVSSHLLGEVEQIATHIGILNQGCLVLEGALAALKAEFGHEVALAVGDPERACALAHAKGFAVSRDADALIARFAASENPHDATAALTRLLCLEGVDIHAVTPRQHSLEALYHRNAHPAQ